MSEDTRDLVIAFGRDLAHVVDKLDEHITETKAQREALSKKLDCIEKKLTDFSNLREQAKGAGMAIKAGWAALSLVGFAGVAKFMHVFGWLR